MASETMCENVSVTAMVNDPEEVNTRLYVGGLFCEVTETDLYGRFEKFGEVSSVDIVRRRDDKGKPERTFAFVNLTATDQKLKKCIAVYNKSKWKGHDMQIQVAKESFLARLAKEREATKTELITKEGLSELQSSEVPGPSHGRQWTVQGAVPGTAVEGERNWVVGKYGRILPVVYIRRKDKKKVMKVNPSKYSHNLKKIKEERSVDPPISQLTWSIPVQGSEDSRKKRQGDFSDFLYGRWKGSAATSQVKNKKMKMDSEQSLSNSGDDSNIVQSVEGKVDEGCSGEKENSHLAQDGDTASADGNSPSRGDDSDTATIDVGHADEDSDFEVVSLEQPEECMTGVLDGNMLLGLKNSVYKKQGDMRGDASDESVDTDELITATKHHMNRDATSDSGTSLDTADITLFSRQKLQGAITTQDKNGSSKHDSTDDMSESEVSDDAEVITAARAKLQAIMSSWQTTKNGEKDVPQIPQSGTTEPEETSSEAHISNGEEESVCMEDFSHTVSEEKVSKQPLDSIGRREDSSHGIKMTCPPSLGQGQKAESDSSDELESSKSDGWDDEDDSNNQGLTGTPSLSEVNRNTSNSNASFEAIYNDGGTVVGNDDDNNIEEEEQDIDDDDDDAVDSDEKYDDYFVNGDEDNDDDTDDDDDDTYDDSSDDDNGNDYGDDDDGDDENGGDDIEEEEDHNDDEEEEEDGEDDDEEDGSDDDDDDELKDDESPDSDSSGESLAELEENESGNEISFLDGSVAGVGSYALDMKPIKSLGGTIPTEDQGLLEESEQTGFGDQLKLKSSVAGGGISLANEQRLQTLRQRQLQAQSKQALITKALSSMASSTAGKHIVFGSEDEDSEDDAEVRAGLQSSTLHPAKTEKTLQKGLFESDSEGDSDSGSDDNDEQRFQIKPQFEGKTGEKLLQLQAQIGQDDRFRMDHRFLEQDSDGEEDGKGDYCNMTRTPACAEGTGGDGEMEAERQKSLEILRKVVGTRAAMTTEKGKNIDKLKFNDPSAVRYDPTREDHKQFEIPDENVSQKDAEESGEQAAQTPPQVETVPDTSADRYFQVASDLKEVFSTAEGQAFSFFGSISAETVEDTEEDRTSERTQTTPKKMPWQPKVFQYDSSDEDEEIMITQEDLKTIPERVEEPNRRNSFFFTESDARLKEGVLQFYRRDRLEDIRKAWEEVRPELLEESKKRHKNAVRQKKKNQRNRQRHKYK
ncbi:uncharacterized protein LOC144873797 isoform X3 [Branchiostoma floridae x Branchiostoma japonicum]